MYAVLVEIDVSGVDREAGLSGLRDQIVPLRGPRGRSHRVTENTTQRPRPSPNHSSSTSPATSAGERPVTSSCLTDASLRIQVN